MLLSVAIYNVLERDSKKQMQLLTNSKTTILLRTQLFLTGDITKFIFDVDLSAV